MRSQSSGVTRRRRQDSEIRDARRRPFEVHPKREASLAVTRDVGALARIEPHQPIDGVRRSDRPLVLIRAGQSSRGDALGVACGFCSGRGVVNLRREVEAQLGEACRNDSSGRSGRSGRGGRSVSGGSGGRGGSDAR